MTEQTFMSVVRTRRNRDPDLAGDDHFQTRLVGGEYWLHADLADRDWSPGEFAKDMRRLGRDESHDAVAENYVGAVRMNRRLAVRVYAGRQVHADNCSKPFVHDRHPPLTQPPNLGPNT